MESAAAMIQTSPLIYGLLLVLSFVSFFLMTYSLLALSRKALLPKAWIQKVQKLLSNGKIQEAKNIVSAKQIPLAQLLECGLNNPSMDLPQLRHAMQSRLERISAMYWQPISLLYDIANVATMLGLLGTIVGIFQGVSGAGQSMEAIFTLFDGLAVAIGTTVAGLSLAVCTTIFAALLKWRTTALLSESEEIALEIAPQLAQSAQ